MTAATPKQVRFAELVLSGKDQSAAYRGAFDVKPTTTAKSVAENASRLMRNVKVQRIIDQGRQATINAIIVDQERMVRNWSEAIMTDRNEIAQVQRVPCRYCWGKDHQYQERKTERDMRQKAHQELLRRTPEKEWAALAPFDDMGGIGYTTKKSPNPECPHCDGDGEERLYLADTRNLSAAARMLFEGVEVKNGALVVKMKGREAAEDRLARHLGMLDARSTNLNLNVSTGPQNIVDVRRLSDEQREAFREAFEAADAEASEPQAIEGEYTVAEK